MIGCILPLVQIIQADATDQSDLMESSQWLAGQMEKLTASCSGDRKGKLRRKMPQTNTVVQMKWECKQVDQWLIQISVEAQWKNRKGEYKKKTIKTHRFQAS
mgnify:CR=1 FL=1